VTPLPRAVDNKGVIRCPGEGARVQDRGQRGRTAKAGTGELRAVPLTKCWIAVSVYLCYIDPVRTAQRTQRAVH
jgi:hypothetical protein